jgi:signal transduction histidine kinase
VALLAVTAVFAAIVQSREAARVRQTHRESVQTAAESLAILIRRRYEANEVLTIGESSKGSPLATPMLREIAEHVPGYVWVLDRFGFTIYNSNSVRTSFEASDWSVLDSLVATVAPGGRAVGNDTIGYRIVPNPGVSLRTVPVHNGQLLLYAVESTYRLGGVNRVVVGRLAAAPPLPMIDVFTPYLLVVPVVILVSLVLSGILARLALAPVGDRISQLINEVEAISDGRSLHRRLPAEADEDDQVARLTATLNAMIGRLEQSFGGLRRFTADASHELKTPLTVLRADVERAMATQSNKREQLVALEEALAETTRMADLVESLLTLARADEGRFDLHREPVDLNALARDVFETALLLGESTRVTVKMNTPAPAVVSGDRARLRQLFLNLITNAIKYTPAGGRVELSLTKENDRARFSVRDSGIGIAAADQPHVFERFWRADRARSRMGERGGFGLGLAISQYIAQAHGGTLTVQSRLGRGSMFVVSLPTDPPRADGSDS